jgi:putative hemin transport protein
MTTTDISVDPCEHLRERYADLRLQGMARHRDIAHHLGVSEGELIAAHVSPGAHREGLLARRLRAEWPRVVGTLETVGIVMALTRNASCVHEKTGVYRDASASGPAGRETGLVLGGEVDLRVFYSRWAHGFAVDETTDKGVQRSLQFFDADGTAVHKVFVTPATDLDAWVELVVGFLAARQTPGLTPCAAEAGSASPGAPAVSAERPDAEIDVAAFHQAWASLRDTHEFFGVLKRHGLTRTQALRLAEPRFVRQVDVASAHQVLSGAAASGTPVMVFVGNPGVIQIHTGPVKKVEVIGPWLNVLDRGFNLHLREDRIASAWVVRKPTSDGLVTSLELFDERGETIAMFFGERKPGRAELCAWRDLVDDLVGDRAGFEVSPCTA